MHTVVAINHFVADTKNEINTLQEECNNIGVEAIVCQHWLEGGEGTINLANKVVELADNKNSFKLLYDDKDSLFNKIKTKDIQTWADKNIRSTKFIENIILQKIFVQ